MPQRGHTNPSGQRQTARYCWQASSVANSNWNCRRLLGNGGRGTPLHYTLGLLNQPYKQKITRVPRICTNESSYALGNKSHRKATHQTTGWKKMRE